MANYCWLGYIVAIVSCCAFQLLNHRLIRCNFSKRENGHRHFFTRWPQEGGNPPLSDFSWKFSKIKIFSPNLVSCRSSKGSWIRWEYFQVHRTCFSMSKRHENAKIREKRTFFSVKVSCPKTDFCTEKYCSSRIFAFSWRLDIEKHVLCT